METITSTSNPIARRLRSLAEAKSRRSERAFLVEGEVMIREALRGGLCPLEVLAEAPLPVLDLMPNARIKLCSRSVLESVCDTVTPQGVCASFHLPEPGELPETAARLVALDGVQDPGNVGTILRTADAAGFEGLLLDARCPDVFAPKVQRSSMGSLFRVPCVRGDMPALLAKCKASGYKIVVSALDGEELYAKAPRYTNDRLVLVIGNEAHGVSPEVQALADIKLRIPMRGGAESLNAAVAAGILMFELTRNFS